MNCRTEVNPMRVLVLAPTGRDAPVPMDVLADANIEFVLCPDAPTMRDAIKEGAGAAILSDAELSEESAASLRDILAEQPDWSDLPLIIVYVAGQQCGRACNRLTDDDAPDYPIVLEQPVSHTTLISTVRACLMARTRQFQLRDELASRRRMEAELRQRRRQYLGLVEGLDAIVYEYDIDRRRYTFVSRQAQRILQYPLAKWLTEPDFWESTIVHAVDREAAQVAMNRAVHQRKAVQINYRARRADGDYIWVRDSMRASRSAPGEPVHVRGVMFDITEAKRHEQRLRFLMRELNHRVKNTLATVQATAVQSIRHSSSLEEFQKAFQLRLRSMAQAHSLLSRAQWESASLRELLARELRSHVPSAEKVALSGPRVSLRPKAALAVHMVIHELSTNAVKYGALSCASGTVSIAWQIRALKGDAHLVINWTESNGPRVSMPSHRGFGSEVLEETIEYELNGHVTVNYEPSGLVCEIDIPRSNDNWFVEYEQWPAAESNKGTYARHA